MPFLGNAGQLTHVFVTTLGENSGAGDKSVSIDGAVFASDFKIESSSLANIAPTLQAVTEKGATSDQTIQLSNPTASLIASGRITADSFSGDGRDITNLSATKLSGIIPHRNFGDNVITGSKLASKTITTNKIADSSITDEKIADNSVNTTKLVDASVTTAKIADDAITTSKIANTTITTDKIANGSITADKIAQGAIGTAFIGDGNVTTAKIADDAITTSKIADDAVTTSKISDLSITTAKIADDSVNTAKIVDGNVTTIKLADTSITTAKIVNEAITATKIATGTITGTQIEDGSIPLTKLETTDLTISQIDDNSLSGSKLQRHTITGGDSSSTGDNRGEIGLLTIHNDNIRNSTIDADDKVKDGSVTAAKLNNDVTLSTVTGHGSTTSDAINITNATSSTSKDTGALRVKGGVGVEGNVHATKFIGDGSGLTGLPLTLQEVTEGGSTTDVAINITNATDAISKESGALRVKGGVGVEGNVHATKFIGDGSGLTGLPLTLQEVTEGASTTDVAINITNATDATSKDTGALRVKGGVGVEGNVHATKFIGDGSGLTGLPLTLQEVTEGASTTDVAINITNATDATSKDTGALRVKGGVGVEGNVYATKFIGDGSGLTGISSTFEAITSGVGNSTSNKILVSNAEDATGIQTGALQVTNGGMSVAKNVHIGKDLIVTGNLQVNGSTTTVDSTSLIVKDTIISLAEGNENGNKDVGIIFGKPQSNVAIFYDTTTSRLQFGLTDSHASSTTIDLKEGDLPIHVAGSVTATSFNGNASTATALATARTIGGVSFDGSVAIDLPGVNKEGNQNTTGNAGTATKLATPRTIGGVSFDGSAAIDLPGVNTAGTQNTTGNAGTATKLATPRTIGGVSFDGSAAIDLPGVNTAGNQNTTGNAGTATKLATPRTIGGVSFDGSAAIDLPGVNTAGNQNTTGNASTASKVNNNLKAGTYLTGSDFNGSADVSWSVDADDEATPSKVVARDSLGSFSANVITAVAFSGNASTATTLATPRKINGVDFNGSADIVIPSNTSQSLSAGTYLTGNAFDGSAAVSWSVDATDENTADKVVVRDTNGSFSANVITADLIGNASTADSVNNNLKPGNYITGSDFNGSADVTFSVDATDEATPSKVVVRDDLGSFNANVITAVAFSGNATTADSVNKKLKPGNYITGSDFNGSAEVTFSVDATDEATPSKVVVRDDLGSFNANVITADLIGNATTATTLATPRKINGVDFNGSGDITILSSTSQSLSAAVGGYLTGNNFNGSAAVSWSVDATDKNTFGKVVARDATGDFSANVITALAFSGNATTATTLAAKRKINGVEFDGSGDITILSSTSQSLSAAENGYLTGNNFDGSTAVSWSVDATDKNTPSKVVVRDDVGDFKANVITALAFSGNATTATTLAAKRKINGVEFDGSGDITILSSTSQSLSAGTYLTGNAFDGSTAVSWSVDATHENTFGKVVARNAGGDFTANVITAVAFSGNATTATTLATPRKIGGVSFDGSAAIDLPGVNTAGNQNTTGNAGTATKLATTRTIGGVSFDGSANIDLPGVNTAGTQNTTGNAATATKLATARTIGGVSFDGGDSINLPGVNIEGNQNTTGNAATAGTAQNLSGGSVSATTGTFSDATDASNGAGALKVTSGGLYVNKKIYAGGDITAFSDRRKKSNITRIENALDKVCQLGGYTFDYLGERKTGVIAQEVKEVLPEAVYGSEDTSYSVAYGNLAGILIEAIKELRNEIQELKNN